MHHSASQGDNRTGRTNGPRPRRPRTARACDLCRIKKNKCDESVPCRFCKNRNVKCTYNGQSVSSNSLDPGYVQRLEERVKELSLLLESGERSQSGRSAGDTTVLETPSETSEILLPGLTSPSVVFQQQKQRRCHCNTVPVTDKGATQSLRRQNDVSGVNRHTRGVEFYGGSSSIALLSQIQRADGEREDDDNELLSSLHNPAFRSVDSHASADLIDDILPQSPKSNHYSQCRVFIDNFFASLYHIHPIFEKRPFMEKCERLWSGDDATARSFKALYYSVLSLGALVGLRPDDPIEGVTNIQWSRKFFEEAKRFLNDFEPIPDLETVQCCFIMAKVCQNELVPNWAYMYVGLAVRIALAMGINREPGSKSKKDAETIRTESRTWWSLYALEIEMSFAMGRPDSLGTDLYHSRRLPTSLSPGGDDRNTHLASESAHYEIITHMVTFSRIARGICISIYLAEVDASELVVSIFEMDAQLHQWLEGLPHAIRPRENAAQTTSLKGAKDPQWMKRQRLVLDMRYHNLRILLFGSLLLRLTQAERASIVKAGEGVQQCLESAKHTIGIIFHNYQHNDFFRTWFYNTTYTIFAASIILVYMKQEATRTELDSLSGTINMAIEILEIMDECTAALTSAKLLKRARDQIQRGGSTSRTVPEPTPVVGDAIGQLNQYWGALGFLEGDADINLGFEFSDFEGGGSLFMELDDQTDLG